MINVWKIAVNWMLRHKWDIYFILYSSGLRDNHGRVGRKIRKDRSQERTEAHCVFWTWQHLWTYEFTEILASYTRPELDQHCKNSTIDWGQSHQFPSLRIFWWFMPSGDRESGLRMWLIVGWPRCGRWPNQYPWVYGKHKLNLVSFISPKLKRIPR